MNGKERPVQRKVTKPTRPLTVNTVSPVNKPNRKPAVLSPPSTGGVKAPYVQREEEGNAGSPKAKALAVSSPTTAAKAAFAAKPLPLESITSRSAAILSSRGSKQSTCRNSKIAKASPLSPTEQILGVPAAGACPPETTSNQTTASDERFSSLEAELREAKNIVAERNIALRAAENTRQQQDAQISGVLEELKMARRQLNEKEQVIHERSCNDMQAWFRRAYA